MSNIINFKNPKEEKLNKYREDVKTALQNFDNIDEVTYKKVQNGEKPTEEEIEALIKAMADLARSSENRDNELHRLGRKAPSDDIDLNAIAKEVIFENTGMKVIRKDT